MNKKRLEKKQVNFISSRDEETTRQRMAKGKALVLELSDKIVATIFAAVILSACQTTPKFAPTTVELEGKLQGLAQAGIEEVKCDIYTPEFDETAESFRQETYRRQFGRIFNDLELAALKSYQWSGRIDAQKFSLKEDKSPLMPSSDQLGQHVTFVRDELRYSGGDFTEFYFDLLLDIQGLAPALVPGGFLYTTSKGRKIFLRADFNQITSLSKASDGKDIEKVVSLGTINGFRVPARIQYSEGSYNRTIFYEFDEQSIPPKPKEIIIGFGGADASSRMRFRFSNCEFHKTKTKK